MAGLNDRVMNYLANQMSNPLVHDPVTLDYATLSAADGWTAPENGFVIFGIAPSNTSVARASLRNITDNYPCANITSTNGYDQSTTGVVLKGKTYRVTGAILQIIRGGVVSSLYSRLSRLIERRWRHERVNRSGFIIFSRIHNSAVKNRHFCKYDWECQFRKFNSNRENLLVEYVHKMSEFAGRKRVKLLCRENEPVWIVAEQLCYECDILWKSLSRSISAKQRNIDCQERFIDEHTRKQQYRIKSALFCSVTPERGCAA